MRNRCENVSIISLNSSPYISWNEQHVGIPYNVQARGFQYQDKCHHKIVTSGIQIGAVSMHLTLTDRGWLD
jgi:hypothetical protein